jgi:GNAT superfamily N-acetyltransferase
MLRELAVTEEWQGRGLGSILLADALRRAFHAADTVSAAMLVANAVNEAAARFYAAHGFKRLPGSQYLVLPMRQFPANGLEEVLAPRTRASPPSNTHLQTRRINDRTPALEIDESTYESKL